MPDEQDELFQDLLDKEIQTMEIILIAKASKTAITIDEYIQTRLLQGTSAEVLEKELFKDLDEGGRIFGEFRNAIKATTNGTINRTRDNAIFTDFTTEISYRWVAVMINTCPDCLDRHNTVASWVDWESAGLPRTGSTVCRDNCKCVLLPEENTEIEPIIRTKK